MKLSIMQPYFFPYLGYFSLIKHTDKFIAFDIVQYIRHGWINRNRILKQNGGTTYITVPLRKISRSTLIKDVRCSTQVDWKKKIMGQIAYYRKFAPYYTTVVSFLEDCFHTDETNMTLLNMRFLEKACEYIGIPLEQEIASEMELDLSMVNAPDEWALEISKALKAKAYYNPPGAQALFDKHKYVDADISLKFLKINLVEYQQQGVEFHSGLSIIDVMMFNPPEKIRSYLDHYELL